MVLRKLMGLLACTLIVSFAAVSMADVPNLDLSHAECAAGEQVSVFNTPAGSGTPLSACYAYGGATVDGTITLMLVNDDGEGIDGYAQEEMWLETDMGGLVACTDGTLADGSTSGGGIATWSMALNAGGYTDPASELTVVMISGDALTEPGLDVQHNSPDIDGNGVANLGDIAAFTQVLFGAYSYSVDFVYDGVVNLSDVALMTQGNGTACP